MFSWVLWAPRANSVKLRELGETLICSQPIRSTGDNLGLQVTSEGGQFCGAEPLPCGIWPYLEVDSVRTEFNCRSPSWCHRSAWGVENHMCCQKWSIDSGGDTQQECVCVCVCVCVCACAHINKNFCRWLFHWVQLRLLFFRENSKNFLLQTLVLLWLTTRCHECPGSPKGCPGRVETEHCRF